MAAEGSALTDGAVLLDLPSIVTSRIGEQYDNATITSKELPHSKDQSSLLALVGHPVIVPTMRLTSNVVAQTDDDVVVN